MSVDHTWLGASPARPAAGTDRPCAEDAPCSCSAPAPCPPSTCCTSGAAHAFDCRRGLLCAETPPYAGYRKKRADWCTPRRSACAASGRPRPRAPADSPQLSIDERRTRARPPARAGTSAATSHARRFKPVTPPGSWPKLFKSQSTAIFNRTVSPYNLPSGLGLGPRMASNKARAFSRISFSTAPPRPDTRS